MAHIGGSAVSLWVKIIPEDNSDLLTQAVEHFMNKGRDDRAPVYYYSGFLTEIDYLNNNHRELVTVLYDINKNIFDSTDHSIASWKTISPENSFHLVQAAVYENSKPVAAREYAPVRSGC